MPRHRAHHEGREQRCCQYASVIGDWRETIDNKCHDNKKRERCSGGDVVAPGRHGPSLNVKAGRCPELPTPSLRHQGTECTHQKFRGPRVGSVVDAARISGVKQDHHLHGRSESKGANNTKKDFPSWAQAMQHEKSQGPHEIELHRHAQKPQVCERGGESCRREVWNVHHDVVNIFKEEQCAQCVALYLWQQSVREDRAEKRRHTHHDHDRRHEPSQTSQQKAEVVNRAVPLELALD